MIHLQRIAAAAVVAAGLFSPCQTGAEGLHQGEVDKLAITVDFVNPYGYTTTDPYGIHYHYFGFVFSEPKIYPSATFGQRYPLYFMGGPMNFRVTVRNTAE